MRFVQFHDSLMTMSGHFPIHCSQISSQSPLQRLTGVPVSGLNRVECDSVFFIQIAHVQNAWSYFSTPLFNYVNVKFSPQRDMPAQRENRGRQLYAVLGARWNGWLTPVPGRFIPPERPSVFIVQEETGRAPGPVCRDVEKIESLASTGLRTADRTANSGSLYRLNLSCPNLSTYYENYFLPPLFVSLFLSTFCLHFWAPVLLIIHRNLWLKLQ